MHLSGLEVNQLRALKGAFCLPGSRLVPPSAFTMNVCPFSVLKTTQDARQFSLQPQNVLKTAQDYRQFFVWAFWGPFRLEMHLLGSKPN